MIKTCYVTRKMTLMLQNLGSLELQRLLLHYFKLLDYRLIMCKYIFPVLLYSQISYDLMFFFHRGGTV